eukprot:SAG11_NODE_17145_length_527_cov_0.803738_1_plen_27_part_10
MFEYFIKHRFLYYLLLIKQCDNIMHGT